MERLIFNELPLSEEVLKALDKMGFEEATPIQSLAIPPILEGKDVIGQARTGTGKTCAFGIPAVESLDMEVTGMQVLALCPTRELAIQMAEELEQVAKYKKGAGVLAIYGGQSIDRQIMALKKRPQIIVGTPGRVMDHLRRHTLKVENLRMVVLDEADEMLKMGFREDIDEILAQLPEERQTLLFSATMPEEILEITTLYQKEPIHLQTIEKELTVPSIDQYYIEVREHNKLELLSRLVDCKNVKLGLVFVNTKIRADEVTQGLQNRGFRVEALHGDMKQLERDRVMSRFRKGQLQLLVATDVAARGIDVTGIDVVFNYDLPSDEEYYVHRIGRTGRAGSSGVSYSFVFGRDHYRLRNIQRYTKSKILPMKAPTIADVEQVRVEMAIRRVQTKLDKGRYKKYLPIVEEILKMEFPVEEGLEAGLEELGFDPTNRPQYSAEDVAAVLFGMAFDEFDKRSYRRTELDEEPVNIFRHKKDRHGNRGFRDDRGHGDRKEHGGWKHHGDRDEFYKERFDGKKKEKRRDWDELPPYDSKRDRKRRDWDEDGGHGKHSGKTFGKKKDGAYGKKSGKGFAKKKKK